MAQLSGVVTLRTDRTFQVIPRAEVRQAEVLDNATVKWWLTGDENPFSCQFFDEDGDQALNIAEHFYADIAVKGTAEDAIDWVRTSDADDEGETWERNGQPAVVERHA